MKVGDPVELWVRDCLTCKHGLRFTDSKLAASGECARCGMSWYTWRDGTAPHWSSYEVCGSSQELCKTRDGGQMPWWQMRGPDWEAFKNDPKERYQHWRMYTWYYFYYHSMRR